jgi:hypothetical protein
LGAFLYLRNFMAILDRNVENKLIRRVFARHVALSANVLTPQELSEVSGARLASPTETGTFTASPFGPGGEWDEMDC